MVLSVCWRVLNHCQDAEEACQRTFLMLLRDAAAIRDGHTLKSWLHTVADHVAKDVRKSKLRHESHECPCGDCTQITQITPADEVEFREMKALINTEISRLPEVYRVCFILHCLEGKSKAEIAALLGIPEGTVASRVRKAREKLRRGLAKHDITPLGE